MPLTYFTHLRPCSRRSRLSRAVTIAGALVAALVLVAGCSSQSRIEHRQALAQALAQDAGFERSEIPAGDFRLTTWHRGLHADTDTLLVYIEGDGHAWERHDRLSVDPTPENPVGLRMALRDPAPAVLYVARPCQYADDKIRAGCNPIYWSSHRYAEEVVAAVNAAIDWALNGGPEQTYSPAFKAVGLAGYSGGGTVAALVAARRNDVAWLVTVAANLDHPTWTRLHGHSPLTGSLNPSDFATELRSIPQLHLVGADDDNVPVTVSNAYLERLGGSETIRVEVIAGFNHRCCWAQRWPEPLCSSAFMANLAPARTRLCAEGRAAGEY